MTKYESAKTLFDPDEAEELIERLTASGWKLVAVEDVSGGPMHVRLEPTPPGEPGADRLAVDRLVQAIGVNYRQ